MFNRLKTYIKRGLRYTVDGMPEIHVHPEIHCSSPAGILEGRKIIVTGGAKGIGKSIAEKLVSEKADVLITGRDADALKTVADTLNCQWRQLDLQNVGQFDDFMADAMASLGGVDGLINNAGVSLHEWDILKVTERGFDIQFDTNLKGAYFLTQSFIRHTINNSSVEKDILFISSERGEQADVIPYGLTKAAINSLVMGLAKFYAGKHYRINAIAPGVTASELTGFQISENMYYPFNPSGRVYLPEEVAEIVSFMMSRFSRCMSGQILVCNEAKTINSYF